MISTLPIIIGGLTAAYALNPTPLKTLIAWHGAFGLITYGYTESQNSEISAEIEKCYLSALEIIKKNNLDYRENLNPYFEQASEAWKTCSETHPLKDLWFRLFWGTVFIGVTCRLGSKIVSKYDYIFNEEFIPRTNKEARQHKMEGLRQRLSESKNGTAIPPVLGPVSQVLSSLSTEERDLRKKLSNHDIALLDGLKLD